MSSGTHEALEQSKKEEPEGEEPPIRVLIVEDQKTYRRIIQGFLDDAPVPFQTLETPDLEGAIKLLSKRNVDVVVLDLGLPDATWEFDALEELLDSCFAPVIVLTGEGDRLEVAREAAARGAEDCLFKDEVDADRLQRALAVSVERFRYRARTPQDLLR